MMYFLAVTAAVALSFLLSKNPKIEVAGIVLLLVAGTLFSLSI